MYKLGVISCIFFYFKLGLRWHFLTSCYLANYSFFTLAGTFVHIIGNKCTRHKILFVSEPQKPIFFFFGNSPSSTKNVKRLLCWVVVVNRLLHWSPRFESSLYPYVGRSEPLSSYDLGPKHTQPDFGQCIKSYQGY